MLRRLGTRTRPRKTGASSPLAARARRPGTARRSPRALGRPQAPRRTEQGHRRRKAPQSPAASAGPDRPRPGRRTRRSGAPRAPTRSKSLAAHPHGAAAKERRGRHLRPRSWPGRPPEGPRHRREEDKGGEVQVRGQLVQVPGRIGFGGKDQLELLTAQRLDQPVVAQGSAVDDRTRGGARLGPGLGAPRVPWGQRRHRP